MKTTLEEQLDLARKALLALAVGSHREATVNPQWVVATALHGLGVPRPQGILLPFINHAKGRRP